MSYDNIFIDSCIILDTFIPYRKRHFKCSNILLDNINNGKYNGWTFDFVLAEVLDNLKKDMERRKNLSHIHRDVLSRHEIRLMVQFIENFKKIPNLNIIQSPTVKQEEIYEKVKTSCIGSQDALILLSSLQAQKSMRNTVLVTRDNKFLHRAKNIALEHPSFCLSHCPQTCGNRHSCRFYKP